MPSTDEFREHLASIMKYAVEVGAVEITLNAGKVHRSMGHYPGPQHRMYSLCNAMRAIMKSTDTIVMSPPKGSGAQLTIRYALSTEDRHGQSIEEG